MKATNCIILVSLLLFSCNNILLAQVPLQTVLQECSDQPLPFDGSKEHMFIYEVSRMITNKDGQMYNKIYKDIALTNFYEVFDDDMEIHTLFRKFAIPHSTNKLLIVSLGGVCDFRTDYLVIVSPEGKVLDQLLCRTGCHEFCTIQHTISADGKVLISRLVPTGGSSLSFLSFTQFTGYRVDRSYTITSEGKFVETSVRQFCPKQYTRSELKSRDYLWEGDEVPEE